VNKVAALFVSRSGPYWGREDIDAWDEERDATQYYGPWPVVAHPPCQRWCRLAGLVQARWGHRVGDDGGTFACALASVRRWGGVLEHPAYSRAWPAYGLPRPPTKGGWVRGSCGGWACHVEQVHYGHLARKATWLYVYGVARSALPELRWGSGQDQAIVSWCGNRIKSGEKRPRLSKAKAIHSPPAFAELLIALASGAVGRCLDDY
jgi:hypothetical protein